MKLFFANANFQLSANEIRQEFERFGTVHEFSLITDRFTGYSRGYGFVIMNKSEALAAIAGLDDQWLNGRRFHVAEWAPRTERSVIDQSQKENRKEAKNEY